MPGVACRIGAVNARAEAFSDGAFHTAAHFRRRTSSHRDAHSAITVRAARLTIRPQRVDQQQFDVLVADLAPVQIVGNERLVNDAAHLPFRGGGNRPLAITGAFDGLDLKV